MTAYHEGMPWDPDCYQRFEQERSAPFFDLLELIDGAPPQVIDLGCGTGELTEQLANRWPQSVVLGLDSSPEMLERAQARGHPRTSFQLGRIEDLSDPFDLMFSNAALQWLPEHPKLITRLWQLLRPGGQLAVQVPSNHDHPSHRLLSETAGEPPFEQALGGWTRHGIAPAGRQSPVLSIVEYGELLFGLGAKRITAFEKIYPVTLDDADGVLDWVSGTALVPYLERLPEELRSAFRDRYRARLWNEWTRGPVFYAFKRTLFSGHKS